MSDDVAELRRELEALTERVGRLEDSGRPGPADAPSSGAGAGELWALTALRSSLADHASAADGAVMLVGSLTLPGGAPVAWQQTAGTTGMLETDWSEQAAAFAALGHPVRLELLRLILSGVHATADLAEAASLGTTGQLHHHLRQLVAAGWVRQSGRGTYEVPAARVVPLLAAVAGAQR
jgi:DNA-binding transcriptional ArsR family regulator